MKTRVLISTVAAILLLFAAIVAGLNAIFTVTHVRADFNAVSEEGMEEAHALREKLDAFLGKSSAFLDLDDIREVVEEYPGFRLDSIEKKYPTTVCLTVSERNEMYAFARENGGYAIVDDEGNYLYDKPENVNRVAGENILLEDFSFTTEGGVRGEYFPEVLAVSGAMKAALGAFRANVVYIRLVQNTANPRYDYFRIGMREGVILDILNPADRPAEKTALALERYLALSDEDRIFGFITVVDSPETGEILPPDYSRESSLS